MSLTTLSCFVGLALLGGACSPGSAVSAPRAQLQAPARLPRVAAAEPSPGATAAPPEAPARVGQPEPPAGQERVASWLGNVCQLAVVVDPSQASTPFGCACCPPFDECKPGTATEPVQSAFAPTTAVVGSFTRVGADELALTMPGCEGHSENGGGLLLLEHRAQGFALVRYVSSLYAGACWTVRRDDGRDLLLCERGNAHQGTAEQRLFLWDLAQTDEQLLAAEEVFSVIDNSWSGCWSPVGTEVSSVQMRPPELRTEGGRVELTVQLDARVGRVTGAYLARCSALQQAEDGAAAQKLPSPTALLARSTARVTFHFDGTTFVRRR